MNDKREEDNNYNNNSEREEEEQVICWIIIIGSLSLTKPSQPNRHTNFLVAFSLLRPKRIQIGAHANGSPVCRVVCCVLCVSERVCPLAGSLSLSLSLCVSTWPEIGSIELGPEGKSARLFAFTPLPHPLCSSSTLLELSKVAAK